MVEWDLAIRCVCDCGVESWEGRGVVEDTVGANEVGGEGPSRGGGGWGTEEEVDEEGAGESGSVGLLVENLDSGYECGCRMYLFTRMLMKYW